MAIYLSHNSAYHFWLSANERKVSMLRHALHHTLSDAEHTKRAVVSAGMHATDQPDGPIHLLSSRGGLRSAAAAPCGASSMRREARTAVGSCRRPCAG